MYGAGGNKSTYEVAGSYAADKLKKLLLKKTDFNFIEKNKIQKVVSDLNYNMTELNPRKIKKIGELLAADAVIVEGVSPVAADGLLERHAALRRRLAGHHPGTGSRSRSPGRG